MLSQFHGSDDSNVIVYVIVRKTIRRASYFNVWHLRCDRFLLASSKICINLQFDLPVNLCRPCSGIWFRKCYAPQGKEHGIFNPLLLMSIFRSVICLVFLSLKPRLSQVILTNINSFIALNLRQTYLHFLSAQSPVREFETPQTCFNYIFVIPLAPTPRINIS